MVDVERICCMCGDVGFPDKIFRCISCHNRFQHSYCSNYYNESSKPLELCDWCQADKIRSSKRGSSSSSKKPAGVSSRLDFSAGNKIKQHDREEESEKGKPPTPTGTPSPRTRKYKLLKDVMC